MKLEQRINAFVQLGKVFQHLANNDPWPGYESGLNEEEYRTAQATIQSAERRNGWFTEENIRFALESWAKELREEKLKSWLATYKLDQSSGKNVAVIMAGNIPLVGFHDALCILFSGNRLICKVSSQDAGLTKMALSTLQTIEPEFEPRITVTDKQLQSFDAVIATGSDNSARYFEAYFSKYPHIIRHNRNSVGVINGEESQEELGKIGEDIFRYFGLGCRNVSKLFFPEGYRIDSFYEAIYPYKEIINHNKYANNYDYNKALYLMGEEKLLDNGFLILKEDEKLTSPPGILFYEFYQNDDALKLKLESSKDDIQCIVGKFGIPFGKAQTPSLSDYADDVDTMAFLSEL